MKKNKYNGALYNLECAYVFLVNALEQLSGNDIDIRNADDLKAFSFYSDAVYVNDVLRDFIWEMQQEVNKNQKKESKKKPKKRMK